MGIWPMGSAAQNQAPYFALGASNSPQQWERGAGMLAIPEQQPADGNRSGKASESLGTSCAPEEGPFPLPQGVGGGEDRGRMLGMQVPPCTLIHTGGKSYSEPKTSVYSSAEPTEVRSQAASCCTEAQLAAFLLLNGNARLRQKQPLALTGRSLLAPASVWVDHFPFPGGFCRCLNRSAAKLVHPRLFFWGGEKEVMETALRHEVSERWSKEGDGDLVLRGDHRSKISVAVSSGYLPGPQMERGICSAGKESGLCLLYFFRKSMDQASSALGKSQFPIFSVMGSEYGCFPCAHITCRVSAALISRGCSSR